MAVRSGGGVVSRSRVRGRVVSSQSRRCSSFSLAKEDVELRPGGRRRSLSYSVHHSATDRGDPNTPNPEEDEADVTFTWSPLPTRRAPAGDVCLALFCDDTWADVEQFESLSDALPPARPDMPTPTHSSASSTLRRRATRAEAAGDDGERGGGGGGFGNFLQGSFEEEDNAADEEVASFRLDEEGDFGGLGDEPLAEGGCRPLTNPRDTPTHHSSLLLQSPSRTMTDVGKEDLTLESLHDLEWLQRMDPSDQMILEVHIIWSILTLMVVLLACYSIQHHTL